MGDTHISENSFVRHFLQNIMVFKGIIGPEKVEDAQRNSELKNFNNFANIYWFSMN